LDERHDQFLLQDHSLLGALKVYIDDVSGRINTEERGLHIGDFDTGEQILALYNDGNYEVRDFEINEKIDLNSLSDIIKFTPDLVISAVYYDIEREATYIKRFNIETTTSNSKFYYLNNEKDKFLFATIKPNPVVSYAMRVGRKKLTGELNLAEFIDVKGWKAIGNKFSDNKLYEVEFVKSIPEEKPLKAGDTISFDEEKTTLF